MGFVIASAPQGFKPYDIFSGKKLTERREFKVIDNRGTQAAETYNIPAKS
jgi:hypothetical protein